MFVAVDVGVAVLVVVGEAVAVAVFVGDAVGVLVAVAVAVGVSVAVGVGDDTADGTMDGMAVLVPLKGTTLVTVAVVTVPLAGTTACRAYDASRPGAAPSPVAGDGVEEGMTEATTVDVAGLVLPDVEVAVGAEDGVRVAMAVVVVVMVAVGVAVAVLDGVGDGVAVAVALAVDVSRAVEVAEGDGVALGAKRYCWMNGAESVLQSLPSRPKSSRCP